MRIEWKGDHVLDNKKFDAQHKNMADIVNSLDASVKAGEGKEAHLKLLGELVAVTKSHFTDEEKALEDIDYPELLDHVDEHLNLLQEIEDMKKGVESGEIALREEEIDFIANWLIVHIVEMDSEYTAYLK